MKARKVERLLKTNSKSYISHYLMTSTLYDVYGDELGTFSSIVFDRMLSKNIICKIADSSDFWSKGYFQLTTTK